MNDCAVAAGEVLSERDITGGDETKEYYFRPSDNGTYNFGIHDYSINGYWYIDDVEIKAIATTSAPVKVVPLSASLLPTRALSVQQSHSSFRQQTSRAIRFLP